jgi:hypothetical protein
MSKSSKSAKAKQDSEFSAEVRSLSIEQDVAAFLSSGGKIQEIPRGVSGQVQTSGPKHINLGNKSKG